MLEGGAKAVEMVGRERVSRMIPRPRICVDKILFLEIASVLFTHQAGLDLLRRMGVIREKRHRFEVWCADDPLQEEIMPHLIEFIGKAKRAQEARMFHVYTGQHTLLFPWVESLTLQDVMQLLSAAVELGSKKYKLLHLGRPVRKTGRLLDCGVRPGAFLRLVLAP